MNDGVGDQGNQGQVGVPPDFGPTIQDSFTETTSKSWFQRIKEAIGGIVTGFFLILAAIALLFWNEGRAVKTADALTEGAGAVVEAAAGAVSPALEGKLVHVAGPIRVTTPPRDADLEITAAGLRLERKVEMFQWREKKISKTEKKLGGGEETVTTYSYEREWSDDEQKSDGFRQPQGHVNPAMPLRSKSFAAPATLGAYQLAADRAGGLGSPAPLALDARQAAAIGARLNRPATVGEGRVFLGRDPAQPQIGDLRISYTIAKADQASVVAAQKGPALVPFVASNGRSIFLAREGDVPAAAMFENAQQGNSALTWALRGLGLILSIAGFKLILRIASVLADVVPLFGNIVAAGTGFVATLLGGSLAALVAGIAWIVYRPLLGIALLAVAIAAAGFVLFRAKAAGPAARPASA